jgi:pectate lyase
MLVFRNPYITIAGHTAPGDGITVKGELNIRTNDVIISYIRVRSDADHAITMVTSNAYDIIIDHASMSWGKDEVSSTYSSTSSSGEGPHLMAIQWSIISEGLMGHSKGLLSGRSTQMSVHHTIFAHNHERSPRIQKGDFDFVNNIVYNWGGTPGYVDNKHGSVNLNYIGNYIKPGVSSDKSDPGCSLRDSGTSAYVRGNIGPFRPDSSYDEWLVIDGSQSSFDAGTRFNFPAVTTYSCDSINNCQAYDYVLEDAGANKGLKCDGTFFPRRDTVDVRILNDVKRGTGELITYPSDVGGWPSLNPGTPCTDSDHDGMPNDWENRYNFNPNSSSDGNQDNDGDGYTNIEEYLNGTNPKGSGPTSTIVVTPTPETNVPGDGNGDEVVDIADYPFWINNYNTQTSGGPQYGDFNKSGFVDGIDYTIWLNNYTI